LAAVSDDQYANVCPNSFSKWQLIFWHITDSTSSKGRFTPKSLSIIFLKFGSE
jgi:hypothetical protein